MCVFLFYFDICQTYQYRYRNRQAAFLDQKPMPFGTHPALTELLDTDAFPVGLSWTGAPPAPSSTSFGTVDELGDES